MILLLTEVFHTTEIVQTVQIHTDEIFWINTEMYLQWVISLIDIGAALPVDIYQQEKHEHDVPGEVCTVQSCHNIPWKPLI